MDDICYKYPNILRLRGITLKDYISPEDAIDEQLLNETMSDGDLDIIYDKIPDVFTGCDSWPSTTNLRCWSCGFNFSVQPKFIPTYIRKNNNSYQVGVKGNTCSFACAEYIIENSNLTNDERIRLQNNLCFLYFLYTGENVNRIKPALPRTRLLQYGGDLDEVAFLKEMKELV